MIVFGGLKKARFPSLVFQCEGGGAESRQLPTRRPARNIQDFESLQQQKVLISKSIDGTGMGEAPWKEIEPTAVLSNIEIQQ